MFTHLHVRSWFSFLAGGSSPETLARRAAALDMEALAITDVMGVYGAVRFQKACREEGVRPIFGAELCLNNAPLVVLAASPTGYANLCRLLTEAHLASRKDPSLPLHALHEVEHLRDRADGLFCLTGGTEGQLARLVSERRVAEARRWLDTLQSIFGDRLSVEVTHHLGPDDRRRAEALRALARAQQVPILITGDVRHASHAEYRRYDLLTCIRLGLSVFQSHPARPGNGEALLRSERGMAALLPFPEGFARAKEIARACHVDLLPGAITPPAARLPAGETPRAVLHRLCFSALNERYRPAQLGAARRQLERELGVIGRLDLDEFFLVVHEIVTEARRRGIRCAGRGSAANSIVAFLLTITGVDPIAHNLLFERFLHSGRSGTPDIDVDFDSERREEMIAWMEERFSIEQTAMAATVVTYRLRSALRDCAKALGWPLEVVNKASKAVPHGRTSSVSEYREVLGRVLGASPLLNQLVGAVASLTDCPRHLGLHSGGMILSREPLYRFTPIQTSANGVKMAQFDKDDVEALGLVKFDALGLRMLAALSEAVELRARHEGDGPSIDTIPLDDVATFNLIRAGRTLGTFQIESQGQLHLLARNQPDSFDDLIAEIALFRPGPLQGGMVHPFVRRRRGLEAVTYEHPSLEPILRDTYGIILFQEQVLEIAHHFAGMSLAEADAFRRLMSKFRDPGEMEDMRSAFVQGAGSKGVPLPVAESIFDKVANFVGYGFCRSHAAAFAKTVYQSCYLKCHHPAAYMAAIMQHRPGMYNLMTLEEEARRFGVSVLGPDIHRSGIRYDLERSDGALAIRKPLTSVRSVSAEHARAIVWERLNGAFTDIEDLFTRLAVPIDAVRSLARSGALDDLSEGARDALWRVNGLYRRLGVPGKRRAPSLFSMPTLFPQDVPALAPLTRSERLSWDYATHGAARVHPMGLVRRTLNDLEIRPISHCYSLGRALARTITRGGPSIAIAGICMLRQRPPTANGVLFVTLEDETGHIQCIVYPKVMARAEHVLRQPAMIVRGELQVEGNWRGLVVHNAWLLDNMMGGYAGHLSYAGGRDIHVTVQQAGSPREAGIPRPG